METKQSPLRDLYKIVILTIVALYYIYRTGEMISMMVIGLFISDVIQWPTTFYIWLASACGVLIYNFLWAEFSDRTGINYWYGLIGVGLLYGLTGYTGACFANEIQPLIVGGYTAIIPALVNSIVSPQFIKRSNVYSQKLGKHFYLFTVIFVILNIITGFNLGGLTAILFF